MNCDMPLLVLVSGAPASGKTTLAAILARELGLPLLSKDAIKEALGESLDAADREASRALGQAAYAVLHAMIGTLLDATVGAVVDCNFHRGVSEADLRRHEARANMRLVHCETTPHEIARRYEARTARGERHRVHHDAVAMVDLRANLMAGHYEPLDLAIPMLRVDTTGGYAPDLPTIVRFVRSGDSAAPKASCPTPARVL